MTVYNSFINTHDAKTTRLDNYFNVSAKHTNGYSSILSTSRFLLKSYYDVTRGRTRNEHAVIRTDVALPIDRARRQISFDSVNETRLTYDDCCEFTQRIIIIIMIVSFDHRHVSTMKARVCVPSL